MSLTPPRTPTSDDRMMGERVRLRQPVAGYRAGADAALLAAAAASIAADRALEAGCGPGAALLQTAVRRPTCRLVGVEREAEALELARTNIALNGLQDRVEARGGDVGEGFAALELEPFDVAFANPPYFDDPGAIRGPSAEKRAAWIANDGLAAWTSFLVSAVGRGGSVVVIHRADRLADLLSLLAEGAGSLAVRPVHAFADASAKRVLVRAVRGGRAPLVILPALVLHERGRSGHTPFAEALLRGEAELGW